MIRNFSALLAAFAFAFTTLAPVSAADARDRRGYYEHGRHHRDYDHRRWRHRDRDHGDELAAGAVGLVLGLAIGSLASQPRQPHYNCYDNYQRCAPPPPRCADPCRYEGSYYRDDQRYRDSYYEEDSAYAREYGGGYEGGYDPYLDDRDRREQCTRRERQWDRYANRYVTVDVPC